MSYSHRKTKGIFSAASVPIFMLCTMVVISGCRNEFEMQSTRLRMSMASETVEYGYVRAEDVKDYDRDKTYYWSDRSKVFSTEGSASGLVFDGSCTSYFPNGQVKSKGEFDEGLRVGERLHWNERGEIIRLEKFKDGLLHGEAKTVSGDTVETQEYKNGLKHGTYALNINGRLIEEESYKRGVKIEESRDTMRTTTDTSSNRGIWKIFSKNKRDTTTAEIP